MNANFLSFILVGSFFLCAPHANASFNDFPDGWSGDTSLFVYLPDTDIIRLNAPEETVEAFLFHPSSAFENAEWNIGVHLDFNPSSSNYLQIYLATDGHQEFRNGFYLVVGTTQDNISLWERQNGDDHLLIEGTEDLLDNAQAIADIRVTRQKGGHWTLASKTDNDWTTEGSAQSNLGFSSTSFGLSCHYTKTRRDKFHIGPLSIAGEAYVDSVPPAITEVSVQNGYNLKVLFSEPLAETCTPDVKIVPGNPEIKNIVYNADKTSATLQMEIRLPDTSDGEIIMGGWCDTAGNLMKDTTVGFSYISPGVSRVSAESFEHINLCFNKWIDPGLLTPNIFRFPDLEIKVDSIEQTDDNCFRLHLQPALPGSVVIDMLLDSLVLPEGDTIPNGPYPVYYHEASPRDLVITEIMHDPNPPALLPDKEYIELYNRSLLPVDLNNMIIAVNDKELVLPQHLLFPGEYVVLYRDGDESYPNGLPLGSWRALTNGGGEIVLRNPSGIVITAFRYPATLSGTSFKQKGGWSFEIVDTENLSGNLRNWAYCQNERGGTPGEPNSIKGPNPDLLSPRVEDAWLENDSVLVLDFGEPLVIKDIIPEYLLPENPGLTIDSIMPEPVFGDRVAIRFQEALIPHEIETLVISNQITDLAGNPYSGNSTIPFARPGPIDSLDLVINELLYNPPSFGGDYVEIYNRSSHVAALDSISLARGTPEGYPEELIRLSDRTRWLLPGWHICFAANAAWVEEHFSCKNPDLLRPLPKLPNYVNAGGIVFLTRPNGTVIDRFDYSPELHFPLLSDTKAVALERTLPEGPTNNPMTWHSASSEVNYGTPTGPNSQLIQTTAKEKPAFFSLSPEIFRPNQDGTDDLLIIDYEFEKPGQKGTFIVYDAEGRQVKQLVNNHSLSTSGRITWDGTTDDNSGAPPGIYIIWARVFDLKGNVREYKESCVLGIRRH